MRQGNIYSVTRRPLGRNFYWHSRGLRSEWIMLLVQMLVQCQFASFLKGIVCEGLSRFMSNGFGFRRQKHWMNIQTNLQIMKCHFLFKSSEILFICLIKPSRCIFVLNQFPFFFVVSSCWAKEYLWKYVLCFLSDYCLVRTIFECLLHNSRKANATQVIGDLAPFLWRAKQMFCVTSSPRPIDSRVVKIFSFNGSRLFTVRLSSIDVVFLYRNSVRNCQWNGF